MKFATYLLGVASAAPPYSFGPIPDSQTCGHALENCHPMSVCGGPFMNLEEWKLDNDGDVYKAAVDDTSRAIYGLEEDFDELYVPWAAAPFHRFICMPDSACG